MNELVYEWHGHLVNVEIYESGVDVTAILPAPPGDGVVPDGERWCLVWFRGDVPADGFWCGHDTMTDHADAISLEAIDYERDDE